MTPFRTIEEVREYTEEMNKRFKRTGNRKITVEELPNGNFKVNFP